MKTKVLLDVDGVIANFYHEFARFLNEERGCTFDINQEPKSYSFSDWGHGVENVNMGDTSNAWIRQGGILDIPIFDGAKEFVSALIQECDVSIVTARIGDWERNLPPDVKIRVKQDTYEWLEKHDIPTDKLHFVHKKIDFCQENNISTMIEDKLSTALEASKNGINTILVNRGYNGSQIDRFRIYRTYSFDEVLDKVRKLNP